MIIFVLMFCGFTVPAHASALSPYAAAYENGEYREAIILGENDASAEALVLAARSRLALIDLGQSNNHKIDAKAALANAEKAMVLDPKNAEAHLMKVAALGILARGMSRMKSFRKGIAGKSRNHIDAALALEPQSAWAQAMLGMWHLEIIRRGGKFGARVTGANAIKGAQACAKAMQSHDYDVGMGTQCALALLVCREDFSKEASAALRQASQYDDSTIAYNVAMGARASEILDILETQGLKIAQQRALFYLNYTAT